MATQKSYQKASFINDFLERKRRAKIARRQDKAEQLVKHAMETQDLQFKDEEAYKTWKNFVESNSKDSQKIVNYAEYWAKYMQYIMETRKGVTIAQIASWTSMDAILVVGWMDGHVYFTSIELLSQVWKYGEELSEWEKNKKYEKW